MSSKTELVRIRPIERSDLATFESLCREHAEYEGAKWQDDSERVNRWAIQFFGATPQAHCWLACDRDNIVGYVSCTLEYSTWRASHYLHMDCLFVREQHRGQGIGSLLFKRVIEFARTKSIGKLEWQTPDWNESAAGFYVSLGASGSSKHRFQLETNNKKDCRNE